jgi:hypothetical protein
MDISRTTTAIPRFLIRLYQWATMGSARRCRFYPSCSEYMLEALEAKGLRRGLLSGASRLVKCHPWHPGGYDPLTNSELKAQGSEISLSSELNSLNQNL